MENYNLINKDVNIVAYYFRNERRNLRCFPKKMEFAGRTVEFTETGQIQPAGKGAGKVHVFHMTDGSADYRLEFDAKELSWTLVSIKDNDYAARSTAPAFAS